MKKGFTLVELLALIIILMIISLITIPMINGVIKTSKMGAAESSALGYVHSLETSIATYLSLSGKTYQDDIYGYDEIPVSIKGEKPTKGLYKLSSNRIVEGVFCINGYMVNYNDGKAKVLDKSCDDMKLNSQIVLSIPSVNLTYPETIKVLVTNNKGAISCKSNDESIATCSVNENEVTVVSGIKKGNTTLIITSAETSKYNKSTAIFEVMTNPGELSGVKASGYSGTYDGLEHSITVTTSLGTITYSEDGETFSEINPTYINAGIYTVFYKVEKAGYTLLRGSKTVEISKAEGNVIAPTSKILTYNGTSQPLINAGSSTTGTIQYKMNSDGTYSTSIPSAIEKGTYVVYYKVVGDKNHNDVAEQYIEVNIEKPYLSVFNSSEDSFIKSSSDLKATQYGWEINYQQNDAYYKVPSLSYSQNNIKITQSGAGNASAKKWYQSGTVYLNNKIDFTNYNNLKVDYQVTNSGAYGGFVITEINDFHTTPVKRFGNGAGSYNVTYDISTVKGEYYLGFIIQTPYSEGAVTTAILTIKSVTLTD